MEAVGRGVDKTEKHTWRTVEDIDVQCGRDVQDVEDVEDVDADGM